MNWRLAFGDLSLPNFFFCFLVIPHPMHLFLILNLQTSMQGDGIFDNAGFLDARPACFLREAAGRAMFGAPLYDPRGAGLNRRNGDAVVILPGVLFRTRCGHEKASLVGGFLMAGKLL